MLELEEHIPGLWYGPELPPEERIYDLTLSPDFAGRMELKYELLQSDQNKEVKFILPVLKVYALGVVELVGY